MKTVDFTLSWIITDIDYDGFQFSTYRMGEDSCIKACKICLAD